MPGEKEADACHGNFKVLKQVSIDIQKGEFLTIAGADGAGKTTLLNVISGDP